MGNVQLSPEKFGNSWRLPNNAEEHCRTAGGPSFSGRDPRRSGTGGAACAGQHREWGFYYNPFIVAQFVYIYICVCKDICDIFTYIYVCVCLWDLFIYIYIYILCVYVYVMIVLTYTYVCACDIYIYICNTYRCQET